MFTVGILWDSSLVAEVTALIALRSLGMLQRMAGLCCTRACQTMRATAPCIRESQAKGGCFSWEALPALPGSKTTTRPYKLFSLDRECVTKHMLQMNISMLDTSASVGERLPVCEFRNLNLTWVAAQEVRMRRKSLLTFKVAERQMFYSFVVTEGEGTQ